MICEATPSGTPPWMTFQHWYSLPAKRKSWGYKSVADWVSRNPGRAAGHALNARPVRYWLEEDKHGRIRFQWSVANCKPDAQEGFLVELTEDEAREWIGLKPRTEPLPEWRGPDVSSVQRKKQAPKPATLTLLHRYGDTCRLLVSAGIMPQPFETWCTHLTR